MPTFDIVSETDMNEVENALQSVRKEITTRYDFKGTKSTVEKEKETITVLADDDYKLTAIHDLLKVHFTRRKVDPGALDYKTKESASGNMIRQKIVIREGIDQETGKKIVKAIKDSKIKVQVSIQGDVLRVSGKKRDELQETIAFVKGLNIELPLQYINFRD